MSAEIYPCYVKVVDEKGAEDPVELPTAGDGTVLLSTIQAQFPDAIGLRFKSESGGWRGVRISEGVLDPPIEGWGDSDYFITLPKAGSKRKVDDKVPEPVVVPKASKTDNPKRTKVKMQDLVLLSLHYNAKKEDVQSHFEQFGELDMCMVKFDAQTKKSRGFGIIRFKTHEAVDKVLAQSHSLMGRKMEVRFPTKEIQVDCPSKLFVGSLPKGTTKEELKEYFSQYGYLTDVYMPATFRGYGFVTFATPAAASETLKNTKHMMKGVVIAVSIPKTKPGEKQMQTQGSTQGNTLMNMQNNLQRNMPGNLQGNMAGNMQNNLQRNMQVNPQGNMLGNMQNNLQKNIAGNTQGNMQINNMQKNLPFNQQGNMLGNMQNNNMQKNAPFNLQGNMLGNMQNNVQKNASFNQQGNMLGNMQNNMQKNASFNQQGNMLGNITANMQRNVPPPNLLGNMSTTNMQGNMLPNLQGNLSINMQSKLPWNNVQNNMQRNTQSNNMQFSKTGGLPGQGYGYNNQGMKFL